MDGMMDNTIKMKHMKWYTQLNVEFDVKVMYV